MRSFPGYGIVEVGGDMNDDKRWCRETKTSGLRAYCTYACRLFNRFILPKVVLKPSTGHIRRKLEPKPPSIAGRQGR